MAQISALAAQSFRFVHRRNSVQKPHVRLLLSTRFCALLRDVSGCANCTDQLWLGKNVFAVVGKSGAACCASMVNSQRGFQVISQYYCRINQIDIKLVLLFSHNTRTYYIKKGLLDRQTSRVQEYTILARCQLKRSPVNQIVSSQSLAT